jgi:hypothetical protein
MGQEPTTLNLQQFAGMKGQAKPVPAFQAGDAVGLRLEERAPTAVRRITARVIPSFLFMAISFRKHA